MEDRTLKTEAEVIELVQSSLNNVETEKSFEDNYEVMLKLYCAVKRLKSIRPEGTFRAVGVSFKQVLTPKKLKGQIRKLFRFHVSTNRKDLKEK
jgi:hypothetical protein